MTTLYKYRVKCLNDNRDEFWYLPEDAPVPTTCPINTAHQIDTTQTTIVDTIDDKSIRIKEETTPTGGHMGTQSVRIDAKANSWTTKELWWPFPISALSVDFVTKDIHEGDYLSVCVGKNTLVGAVLEPIIPSTDWEDRNYVEGERVFFNHPSFGMRLFTCIKDTVNNENPTNTVYWLHGYTISVSPTVVQNVYSGYYITLKQGNKVMDLGRVICKNIELSKIRVEGNPSEVLIPSPTNPIFVLMSIYLMKEFEIGPRWGYEIGQSKIGGSYVMKDTKVTVDYFNHDDQDKCFVGRVEYLY